jgi:ATP-dependent exoDNAse (exonuclease V) alpha subunit
MDSDDPRISLKTKSLLRFVDTIVIDEVSMVRADLLGAMDIVLRSIKRKLDVPFGGVRMIMVGDFYQLPPVVPQEEERWLEQKHGSRAGWCFYAPCFKELSPKVFYLAESFRSQGDARYTDLLNAVRRLDPNVVGSLNELAQAGRLAGDDVPRLCARKADVVRKNEAGLRSLGVPGVWVHPVLGGDVSKIPRESQDPIVLAEGARVMILRNGAGYANGSLGTLTSFEETATRWDGAQVPAMGVRVDGRNGAEGPLVTVPRDTSEIIGYEPDPETGKPHKVVVASVEQVPLALGYAWTIHKSQGQTLEKACIDLGRGAFAHGQTYVALSRLTTSAGLYLEQPLSKSDLLLDPDVVEYFEQYKV